MNYPKFSVIIPQKNRAEYLQYTLKTCMLQSYPNLEIIVSDDCSDDNSVEMVRNLQKIDKRIKLLAHTTHVGMRNNFEIALNEVKEGYVIALGGDDGLVPNAIWRMYEILNETGAELLTWTQAQYKYPMNSSDHGVYVVPRKKFNGVKMIKSSDYLNKISRTLDYMTQDCPMFYVKGVASMNIVNRVKSRTPDGRFYFCPTPDGYSGVVLAGEVNAYAYTQEPLSISGDSPKSQGRNYHRSDDRSRLESERFFNDSAQITMHSDLASQQYSPLITLMTADYLLTARDLPGWPGEFDEFTIEHLIKKTFNFIAKSRFEQSVLKRELDILYEIAKQHNKLDLYNNLLCSTKRKRVAEISTDGFLVTPNVFQFKGTDVGVNNIYDACLATNFAYQAYNQFSFKFLLDWFKRTLRLYLHRKRYKVEKLVTLRNL